MTTPHEHDARVRAWNAVHALEGQAMDVEAVLGELKRLCLHDGGGAVIAGAVADLRAMVRRLQEDVAEAEVAIDAVTEGAAPPERRAAGRGETGVLRGTTDVVSIADLFGFLASLQKTGTLTLQAPEAMFVFELQDGVVVHAATNRADPELRLGTILVEQGLLTEAELHDRVQESAAAHALLGAHLVDQEAVAADDLRGAIAEQVHRIFDAAFAAAGARFAFTEGSLSHIAQRASLNTTHLLLEAARLDDERRRAADGALDRVLPG